MAIEQRRFGEHAIDKEFPKQRLSETHPLSVETEGPVRVSRETKELLGVQPLRIYCPTSDEHTPQRALLDTVLQTRARTGAAEVLRADANTVFLPGNFTEEIPGMWKHRDAFKRGASGVAIPEDMPHEGWPNTDDVWDLLGRSFTQYGAIPRRNASGRIMEWYPCSMEGAVAQAMDPDELADRLNYIAATKKVTNNEVRNTLPKELRYTQATQDVIDSCRSLREFGFMPPLNLRDKFSWRRVHEIQLFMGSTGLSTGNGSVYDPDTDLMYITASGVDKGNLRPDQVIPVSGIKDSFDGVVAEVPRGVKPPKLSVEALDNRMNYEVEAGIIAGAIKEPTIQEILAFTQNRKLVKDVMKVYKPMRKRQTHFHNHPTRWDPDVFTVVAANPHLVPNGDANASCGTLPLALYSAEMMARGIFAGDGKIIVAVLPRHGVQIFSPLDNETTLRHIDPLSSQRSMEFGAVRMR